jgi:hypothetical protein
LREQRYDVEKNKRLFEATNALLARNNSGVTIGLLLVLPAVPRVRRC